MRKLYLLVFSIVLLTGCNEFKEELHMEIEEIKKEFAEIKADFGFDKSKEKQQSSRSGTSELIDEKDFLNERAEIAKMMEKQRELLKPGFIKEGDIVDLFIYYSTGADSVEYRAAYGLDIDIPLITFSGRTNFSENFLEDRINELTETKALEHASIDGVYGKTDYDTYDMWGSYEEEIYQLSLILDDNDYYAELMNQMSHTFKTEADGAYDPFYHLVNIDLDKMKFPKMNSNYTEMLGASVSYFEFEDNLMGISVMYKIGGYGIITYSVMDKEETIYDVVYTKKDELETFKGMNVTEFEGVNDDSQYYSWSDGTYYYGLEFRNQEKSLLKRDDIFEIIDSAMEDNRTFEYKEVFEATNKTTKYGKEEKELEKLLLKFK